MTKTAREPETDFERSERRLAEYAHMAFTNGLNHGREWPTKMINNNYRDGEAGFREDVRVYREGMGYPN